MYLYRGLESLQSFIDNRSRTDTQTFSVRYFCNKRYPLPGIKRRREGTYHRNKFQVISPKLTWYWKNLQAMREPVLSCSAGEQCEGKSVSLLQQMGTFFLFLVSKCIFFVFPPILDRFSQVNHFQILCPSRPSTGISRRRHSSISQSHTGLCWLSKSVANNAIQTKI